MITNHLPKKLSKKILTLSLLLIFGTIQAQESLNIAPSQMELTTATQRYFHTPSELFRVSVNRREAFVEKFKGYHYLNFAANGNGVMDVVVDVAEAVTDCRISPANLDIKPKIDKQQICFSLRNPGWYLLQINKSEKLLILIDPLKNDAPSGKNVLNIMDFVKDSSGTLLQTAQIQAALDKASKTGKTLLFPRGIYRTGTIVLGSNTHIYLADGAMIKGSQDRMDYPSDGGRAEADHINDKANFSDNGEFMTFSRLILIDNAKNVSIRGRGIIDGSGTVVRAQGKPANLLRIRNSQNVLIEGVILRDPACWNTHILHSEDVTIRGVKVLNDFKVSNTDGFDPDASKRVLIENCFAYCNDDNIAIKVTNNMNLLQDLEDITVRGCVFLTRKSALKVGTETKTANMTNILFENNDVIECDRGLAIYCNDGARIQNVRFINNRIERNYPDKQQRAIQFEINNRFGKGTISDVVIRNCSFGEPFPRGSYIKGYDAEHCIDGVAIFNLTIGGVQIKTTEDLGLEPMKFVKNFRIE